MLKEGDVVLVKPAIIHETVNGDERKVMRCLSNLQSYVKQSTLKEGDAVLVKPAIIHETVNAQGR